MLHTAAIMTLQSTNQHPNLNSRSTLVRPLIMRLLHSHHDVYALLWFKHGCHVRTQPLTCVLRDLLPRLHMHGAIGELQQCCCLPACCHNHFAAAAATAAADNRLVGTVLGSPRCHAATPYHQQHQRQ